MERIIIDETKCTGCGICVEICPYRAILINEGRAKYVLGDCFLCGHCQAVCLENAVEVVGLETVLGLATLEERLDVIQPGTSDGAELVALMRSRRSCRRYKNKDVSLDLLSDLVKIGTTAPSGTNSQSWGFVILPTREDVLQLGAMTASYYRKLNKMAGNILLRGIVKVTGGDSLGNYYRNYYDSVAEALREWDREGRDRLFHGAPAAILVTGKKDASCPAEDALLASQNILLAAHAMGLGSCLIGFVVEAMRRDKKIKKKMTLLEDEEIYSVIALGYPAVTYHRLAQRNVIEPRILNFAGDGESERE